MDKSIWNYLDFSPINISKENQLTLNEGSTPLETITLSNQQYLIKREDLNPSKSFKDRSIAFQLSYYLDNSISEFVISSSGNAGISLIAFAKKYPKLQVHVFLSKTLGANKLLNLNSILDSNISVEEIRGSAETQIYISNNITVYFSIKPKIHSLIFANTNNIKHLRPSHDDMAIVGYKSLGHELSDIKFNDLFMLCSSGNAFLGIHQGLMVTKSETDFTINIIQTPNIHPISSSLTPQKIEFEEQSEVNCIVDRIANRKKEILKHTKSQKAIGHIVYNSDIIRIRKILTEMNHEYCKFPSNTLASLAIAYKVYESQTNKVQIPLVIFSGI